MLILCMICSSFFLISSCSKKETQPPATIFPPPPPPPPPNVISSLHFWTRDVFFGNLTIKINGQTKQLDETWGGPGDAECCSYCGTLRFDIPAGIYEYQTWRPGRDTFRANVTVRPGVCNTLLVSY